MVQIQFTSQLERFLSAPTLEVEGTTLGEALGHALDQNPKLRGYVLDDQGAIRQHVAVFVDGDLIKGKAALGHALTPTSQVYVMQALSGG